MIRFWRSLKHVFPTWQSLPQAVAADNNKQILSSKSCLSHSKCGARRKFRTTFFLLPPILAKRHFRLTTGKVKDPLSRNCQYSFAPAGILSSTSRRLSISSPSYSFTALISMPFEYSPIIFLGGRFTIAIAVFPTSSAGS